MHFVHACSLQQDYVHVSHNFSRFAEPLYLHLQLEEYCIMPTLLCNYTKGTTEYIKPQAHFIPLAMKRGFMIIFDNNHNDNNYTKNMPPLNIHPSQIKTVKWKRYLKCLFVKP